MAIIIHEKPEDAILTRKARQLELAASPIPLEMFSRSNAGRKVIEPLRLGILLGDYPPGERLIENDLAQRFAVSRGSVRIALHVLEGEGLIRRLPNGGKEVVGFSRKDAGDTYDTRWLLERRAIESAAQMPHTYLTPLLDVLKDIETHMADPRLECNWHMTDIRFHRAIVMMARNSPLLRAWETISPLIYALMTLNTSAGYRQQYIEEFYQKHKVIFDCLVTRDERIFDLMKVHIDDAKVISSDLYDQIEARQTRAAKRRSARGRVEPAGGDGAPEAGE